MKQVDDKDKLFFFERHFLTLDGLWMIETENKLGWDKALKIDTEVWKELLKIIIRRLSKYLGIHNKTIENLVKILTFRWTVEGWDFKIKNKNENVLVQIQRCPYKSAMDRNPERHDRIPLICKNMCIPFYEYIINYFNPDIKVQRDKYMGLGDELCNFYLSYKNKIYDLTSESIEAITRVNNDDKLYYFERNFKTLESLWILEVDKETDFSTAVEIDRLVWKRLYQIIFRRVKRYLNLKANNLRALVDLLSFIWSCEGYDYEIQKRDENEVRMKITECPYEDVMKKDPEKKEKIDLICKKMCIPSYKPALKKFNTNITLERTNFPGSGDNYCDFHFILNENK